MTQPVIQHQRHVIVAAVAALVALTAGCSDAAATHDITSSPAHTAGTRVGSDEIGHAVRPDGPRPTARGAAPAVSPAGVAETFDDPSAMSGWRVSYGEPSTGPPASVSVSGGALRIVSSHSAWLDNAHGTGVARAIDGDVTVVVDLTVAGTESVDPTVDWSLAGLMLRMPDMQGRENWLHWTAGYVDGRVLERKATVDGHSMLTLIPIEPGPVRLQLIRVGDKVIMLHRQGDEAWQRDAVYGFPEQPSAAEILLTAQSGFEDDHADMLAMFDTVTITHGAPSAEIVAAVLEGDTSGLAL